MLVDDNTARISSSLSGFLPSVIPLLCRGTTWSNDDDLEVRFRSKAPARAARSVDELCPDWFGAMVLDLYCTDQDEQ